MRPRIIAKDTKVNDKNKKYLFDLLQAPSPSGYEAPAQAVTKAYLKNCADEIISDLNGNLIAVKKGSGKHKIRVVGHADELDS